MEGRYCSPMPPRPELLTVDGREVAISNPEKVFFPATGQTKLELVRYYLAVAEGALRGVARRPMALKRYPNGAAGEFFFQKRAPESRPSWIATVTLAFPSGRTADEIVVSDPAQLAWVVNLGCIDLNPHPVRVKKKKKKKKTTSSTPTSCASTSIPCPACRGTTCAAWPS